MALPAEERLLSVPFLKVALTALLYFVSFGTTLAVLARYAKDELGAGTALVGLVVGSLAIASVLARPVIGQIGDRRGRKGLLIVGPLISAVGYLGIIAAHTWWALVGTRLVVGVGTACVMVGITTMAMDLAPVRRRGEAAAYVLVAVHLGQGSAPIVGEWIVDAWSYSAAWCVAAAGSVLASLSAWQLPARRPPAPVGAAVATGRRQLVHPSGVGPGIIVGLGLIGITGFNALLPLYGDEIGLEKVGVVFMCSSLTIVICRVLGGRLPDRLGAKRGGTFALSFITAGLITVAVVALPVGALSGTVLMGIGASLLFPSLVVAVMDATEERHRAAAVATFTMFIDVANAVGGLFVGALVAVSSYRVAFLGGAAAAATGIVVLRRGVVPRLAVAAARRAAAPEVRAATT